MFGQDGAEDRLPEAPSLRVAVEEQAVHLHPFFACQDTDAARHAAILFDDAEDTRIEGKAHARSTTRWIEAADSLEMFLHCPDRQGEYRFEVGFRRRTEAEIRHASSAQNCWIRLHASTSVASSVA